MKSLRLDDTILHLDTITRVEFEKNDAEITADDQCAVFFIGNGNDPWVVRGKEARPLFEKLAHEMNAGH